MTPEQYAGNLEGLMQAHPWLDTNTAASLATRSDALTMAQQLKTQVAQTWNGYAPAHPTGWSNPGNQAQFLTRHLQAIQATAFHPDDLVQLQEQLQRHGYGKDLSADGRWTSDWQQAMHGRAEQVWQEQTAGQKPGSVKSSSLLHNVLHAINPSGILSAAVGTIKSLPEDVRNLLADTVSSTATLAGGLTWGTEQALTGHGAEGIRASQRFGAGIGAGIENTLGADTNAQEYYNERQNLARVVNDIGTLALFAPEVGAGVRAARGIGSAGKAAKVEGMFTRDAAHVAAQRGPTTFTAKTLASQAGRRIVGSTAVGGAVGGAQAALTGQDIGTGIGQGAALGLVGGSALSIPKVRAGLHLPPKAYASLPVLKSLSPKIDNAAEYLIGTVDEPGAWYRLRTKAATPYQYGAVRLAGTALTEGQKYSLKVAGLSWLENTVGDDPNSQPIARYVAGSHPLDPINNYLDRHLGFTVDGHHFGVNLDDLLYVLHAPLNPLAKGPQQGGLVQSVSNDVHAATRATDAAFQKTGILAQFQHATKASDADLFRMTGGDRTVLHEALDMKFKEFAAYHHVEEVYTKLPVEQRRVLDLDAKAKADFFRTGAAEVFKDPELFKTATARALHSLDEGESAFERYIKNEMAQSGRRQKNDYLSNGMANYVKAVRVMRESVLPHDEHLLRTTPVGGTYPDIGFGAEPRGYRALTDQTPGALGIQRIEGLTRQDHAVNVRKLTAEAADILAQMTKRTRMTGDQIDRMTPEQLHAAWTGNPAATRKALALTERMLDYSHQLGQNPKQLSVFWDHGNPKKSLEQLLTFLTDAGKDLPAEVMLGENAPPELRAALKAVNKHGFRVVFGTDIGHSIRSDLPFYGHREVLGSPLRMERRFVEALGINFNNTSPLDLAATSRNATVQALLKARDSGYITLPRWTDVGGIISHLNADEHIAPQLPWAQNTLFNAARPLRRRNIKQLADRHFEGDLEAAEQRLKADLATVGGTRNLSVEEMTKRLVKPLGNLVIDGEGPWMTEQNARRIAQVIKSSYANTDVHQLGLQHYIDLVRFLPFKLGVQREWDGPLATRMMSLPDSLMRVRDNLRFTLSPMFSARRIFKTNLKMATDGVTPVLNPLGHLVDAGRSDEAFALLDRLNGESSHVYKSLDDAERFLYQSDIFGLYDTRHFEAHYAWEKKQAGASDQEIKDGIIRVFSYGARGKEGRTAAERSMNVIFFPFSFEKTVIRNIGGYLADHQAQALVLSNALAAYEQFNRDHRNNPLALSWVTEHLPVLDEMMRLNAFAHGISLGEKGGINAPLLNAFLPQSWTASNQSETDRLKRLVPVFGDLQRVVKETAQSAQVTNQSFQNGMDTIFNHQGGPFYRRPSNLAPAVQFSHALEYRAQLIDKLQTVLDHNDKVGSNAEKYTFGWDKDLPAAVQGQPISKHTIGLIVQQAFPAYNPDNAAMFVIKRKDAAVAYINAAHGTDRYAAYRDFYDKANTVVGHLNRDDYPPTQAAQAQALFRDAARRFAKTDPTFAAFYHKTFESAFGPLEMI